MGLFNKAVNEIKALGTHGLNSFNSIKKYYKGMPTEQKRDILAATGVGMIGGGLLNKANSK